MQLNILISPTFNGFNANGKIGHFCASKVDSVAIEIVHV